MKKYNCPHCGAELYWDAETESLRCEYCEHEFQPSDFSGEEAPDTQTDGSPAADNESSNVREANEQDRATDESESEDLVVYECGNCGAEVITASSTVATTCAFCGRAISISDKLVGDFRPDAVIPFSITETEAVNEYKKRCKSALLTPSKFVSNNQIKKMKGVYVPFWLHSFDVTADAVINGENIHSYRRGDDKVIEHHMYRTSVNLTGKFGSVPTDGLKHLDNDLMGAVEPFDYSKLTEFKPAYMAGFYAEQYDESSADTIDRAKSRADDTMHSAALDKAGFYETKVVADYRSSFEGETSKFAMLPVWLFNVSFNGKDYQYAVNGETGKFAGKLPLSVPKLLATVFGSGVAVQAIALIIRLLTY